MTTLTTRLTLSFALGCLALGALASTAVAQRGGGGGPGGRNAMPQPKGNFVVVQVDKKLSIIRKSQVAWYKQRIRQQSTEAQKQWQQAAKEAKKNKIKLTTAKPTKKKLQVVHANSKTEEAARKILEARIAKSQKKKDPKAHLEEGEVLENGGRGGRGGARRGGRGGAGAGGGAKGKGPEGGGKKGGEGEGRGGRGGDRRKGKGKGEDKGKGKGEGGDKAGGKGGS